MIIKYSAENFTVKKVIDLQRDDMIFFSERDKKLKRVSSVQVLDGDKILERDRGKLLLFYDGCQQRVCESEGTVYLFSQYKPKFDADHDIVDELQKTPPIDIYGPAFLQNAFLLVPFILLPLVVFFWWLFDSNKNDRDA